MSAPNTTQTFSPAHRRPALISFSGIDGAGKSTQIEHLRAWAENSGLQITLIRFWDQIATMSRLRELSGHALFRGDKGVGSPARPIVRRDKNVRSPIMTCVRLLLYFADAISLRLQVDRALRTSQDLVVCDRFIYDELANLKVENVAIRTYVRFVLKLVPSPAISFLLDAEPSAAYVRKPEYPIEFLSSSRQAYLVLAGLVGGMTVIPPMPAEAVRSLVLQHARQSCAPIADG